MRKTATKGTHLGEYCPGSSQAGQPVYDVYAVPGHVREVKRLWKLLDGCCVTRVAGIIQRLEKLGAAVRQGE